MVTTNQASRAMDEFLLDDIVSPAMIGAGTRVCADYGFDDIEFLVWAIFTAMDETRRLEAKLKPPPTQSSNL